MPPDFDRQTEDASCCRKTCAASADRCTKKGNRVTVSQELFDRSNADENFLKNDITGDEIWVYGYDVETKVQSLQCMGKLSPRPKEARHSRSNVKVMLIYIYIFFVCLFGRISFCTSFFHVARQSIKSST